MLSVWDMILQWGSTIKVSIELPVTTRHRRDMTEKLLKATLNPNTHTHTLNYEIGFAKTKRSALGIEPWSPAWQAKLLPLDYRGQF